MIKQRQNALIMALLVFTFTVFPQKPARAIAPVALAISFVNSAGAVLASEALFNAGTAMIGGMAMAAILITPGDNPEQQLRVPVSANPAHVAAAIPAPVAAATVAPTQTSSYSCQYGSYTASGSDPSAACMAAVSAANPGTCPDFSIGRNTCDTGGALQDYPSNPKVAVTSTNYCAPPGPCMGGVAGGAVFSSGTYLISVYVNAGAPVNTCGAGYTLNGSTCELTNPYAVPDQKQDVTRSAAGFTPRAGDVDPTPAYASINGGKVYAYGKDSSGRPIAIEYAVSPDGTKTYVTHYTQTDVGGQSVVNTQSLTVDAATSQVLSSSASQAQGSIAFPAVAGSPATVNTGATVAPVAASGTQSIVFPTDYARAGEAANASAGINAKLDTVKNSVDDLSKVSDATAPADPTIRPDSDITGAFFGDTFNNLLGWQLPAHSSACPVWEFDLAYFNNAHFRMDSQCTIAEQIRPVLNVASVAAWVLTALFIVLGA